MPPGTKYDKETIIAAAVDLIKEQGAGYFSVRNVAKTMNCSTQPIYSSFSNSMELYAEVLAEIKRMFIAHTKKQYTDKLFRNMGLGFAYFARDYSNLFLAFFQDKEQNEQFVDQFLKDLRTALDDDTRFLDLSSEGKDGLLEKMWIFTYGYSDLIIKGIVKETSDAAIETMIVDTGTAIIKDVIAKEKG